MNQYQLTVLVNNKVSETDRKELFESITKQFGKIEKEDLWGNKDLAYPILKQTKAFFAHFEFESDPATISPLDKMIKFNEDILRYLLIRKG